MEEATTSSAEAGEAPITDSTAASAVSETAAQGTAKARRQLEASLRAVGDDKARVAWLVDKIVGSRADSKVQQTALAEERKKTVALQRERDQLRSEQGRSVVARARMESLCRELQRQNKAVREETAQRARDEEERRKEVATKFQGTLQDLTTMMHDNNDKNERLREDNVTMAARIAQLCDQFERREDEVTRLGRQLELERQLGEATMAKAQLEMRAERELWSGEREALQTRLKLLEHNRAQQQAHVDSLQENVKMYTDKYEQFESTMNKSNKVFNSYKAEIAVMQKQNAALEKDVTIYKLRWKKSDQFVQVLSARKQILDGEIVKMGKKFEQLQKLCRQLQADRACYLKLLHEHKIEPPATPIIARGNPRGAPPAKPIANRPAHATEIPPTDKEEELQRLKQNLRHLEDQFAGLPTNSETESTVSTPASDNITSEETNSNIEAASTIDHPASVDGEDNIASDESDEEDRLVNECIKILEDVTLCNETAETSPDVEEPCIAQIPTNVLDNMVNTNGE